MFLVAAVALIQWAVKSHESRSRRRAETLGSLAGRYGGQVIPGYLAADHKLTLDVDGIPGEVTFQEAGKNRTAWTRIQFNAPSRRRLRVAPEGFTAWLSRLFGSGDILTGDSRFDQTFWVESTDAAWAKDALDPSIRQALCRLRESAYGEGGGSLTLDSGPAGVNLRIGAMLVDDPARLERMIEISIMALRKIHGGAVVGVALEAVEIRVGSECPVCGHAVAQGRSARRAGRLITTIVGSIRPDAPFSPAPRAGPLDEAGL